MLLDAVLSVNILNVGGDERRVELQEQIRSMDQELEASNPEVLAGRTVTRRLLK